MAKQRLDIKTLDRFVRTLAIFRAIQERFAIQQMQVLIAVAQLEQRSGGQGAASQQEIAKTLDLPQSTTSRNLADLAGFRTLTSTPFVRVYENPMNRREKLVNLTPAGEKLVQQVISILEG